MPLKYSTKCLFYLSLLIFSQNTFVTLLSFYIDFSIACVLVLNCWDFYVFVHMCHCVPSMGFKEVWQADVNWQDLLVSMSQRLKLQTFLKLSRNLCQKLLLLSTNRPTTMFNTIDQRGQNKLHLIPQMKLFSKVKWQPRVKPLLSYEPLSVLDNTQYTYIIHISFHTFNLFRDCWWYLLHWLKNRSGDGRKQRY